VNVGHISSLRRMPGVVDGPTGSDAHIAQCLICQAESAKYRTLVRALASLRHQIMTAPDGLVQAVMSDLGRAPMSARRNKAGQAAAAGVAVAVAGAIAVAGWRRRTAA